jgi:hypothetical protein
VHSVSQPLSRIGIKHLYVSTFHTANVLVEAETIEAARLVLGIDNQGVI